MGTMRSRRGGIPGRMSPAEERAGGGGEGVSVAVAFAGEIAESSSSRRPVVCLSRRRVSWIFFHGSSGEKKYPDKGGRVRRVGPG
jgi:hypothetical protein